MIDLLKWMINYTRMWENGAVKLWLLLKETKPKDTDVILLHRGPDGLTHYGSDMDRTAMKQMLQQAADRVPVEG